MPARMIFCSSPSASRDAQLFKELVKPGVKVGFIVFLAVRQSLLRHLFP
jgi:hypothetical protein